MELMKKTKVLLIFSFLFSLLFLTGCVQGDITLSVNADGSGEFNEKIQIDKTEYENSGLSIDVINDEMLKLNRYSPEIGLLIKDTIIDNKEYLVGELTIPFKDVRDLQRKLDRVFIDSKQAIENLNDNTNNILYYTTISGSDVTIDMPTSVFLQGDIGDSKYGYDLSLRFNIKLPENSVIESNADDIAGDTYSWDLTRKGRNIRIKYNLDKATQTQEGIDTNLATDSVDNSNVVKEIPIREEVLSINKNVLCIWVIGISLIGLMVYKIVKHFLNK